jgi:hypothetical protein
MYKTIGGSKMKKIFLILTVVLTMTLVGCLPQSGDPSPNEFKVYEQSNGLYRAEITFANYTDTISRISIGGEKYSDLEHHPEENKIVIYNVTEEEPGFGTPKDMYNPFTITQIRFQRGDSGRTVSLSPNYPGELIE